MGAAADYPARATVSCPRLEVVHHLVRVAVNFPRLDAVHYLVGGGGWARLGVGECLISSARGSWRRLWR
jgi:hypothetical protein